MTTATPTVNVALITRVIDKWPITVAYDLDKLPKVVVERIVALKGHDWKEVFYGDVKVSEEYYGESANSWRKQRTEQLTAAGLGDDIGASVWLPAHYNVKLVRMYLGSLVDYSLETTKLPLHHSEPALLDV